MIRKYLAPIGLILAFGIALTITQTSNASSQIVYTCVSSG